VYRREAFVAIPKVFEDPVMERIQTLIMFICPYKYSKFVGPRGQHGPDPDRSPEVGADGPGPGFQPGERGVYQPGL